MNFDQLFPDEREKADTRIQQCHSVLFRMFKIFEYLCSKYNIEYFLCSGTLKAAVIYRGFKPWDDDFDVGMTRENFERFLQYAVPDLPNDIFFQSPETDVYYPACDVVEAKLRDKYSSYSQEDELSIKWHNGLMLDILVFDKAYLPHNFFIFLLNRTLKLFFKRKGNKARSEVLKWIAKHVPFELVYASSYINGLRMVRKGTNFLKEGEISPLVKTQFEDMEVFIPKGWDNYLSRRYGNYRQIPPLAKQKGHHSVGVPDPFTPCNHPQTISWKDRKKEEATSVPK